VRRGPFREFTGLQYERSFSTRHSKKWFTQPSVSLRRPNTVAERKTHLNIIYRLAISAVRRPFIKDPGSSALF
jgi:hypothetical protein